jgi:hypothetical protein
MRRVCLLTYPPLTYGRLEFALALHRGRRLPHFLFFGTRKFGVGGALLGCLCLGGKVSFLVVKLFGGMSIWLFGNEQGGVGDLG